MLRQIPDSDADKLLILFYSSGPVGQRQPKQDAAEKREAFGNQLKLSAEQEVNLP